ncbi:MAG: putative baseplate assembly protein [Pseudomonadota bacterium]
MASSLGNATADRDWVRARIASATYERPPEILALRTNTVAVTQAETIEFETVGASDGVVAQSLTLRRTPVLAGTLALELDEGGGFEPWEERPDLIGSGPDDPHYVLNRSTGTIQFGDGVHGRIPVANPRNTSNVRARTYRVGGGGKGNLGPNTLTNLRRGVTGIDGDAVTNPFPTGAGQDEETLDEARDRAALALRSRDRAVTAEDFEYLATTAGNVARAKTLPLSHPEFPGIDVPGVVTVIVVPDVDTAQNPKPTPSEATLANVCACLNARRLVTTELYVRAPTYQEVAIDATLVVSDEADLAEVKNTALATLSAYFDPLSGGEDGTLDSAGSGWPFGGDIFYSLVFRRLLLAGVKRIESLAIRLDGTEYPPCSDVALSPGALLCNGPHAIEVRYELG